MAEGSIIHFQGNGLYFEDVEKNVFGLETAKGILKPASDFRFTFESEVTSKSAKCRGYIIKVYPESVNSDDDMGSIQSWTCFLPATSIHRKQDFVASLNSGAPEGVVMCSFEREISDFILQKKRNCGIIPKKEAVAFVGRQSHNGAWTLNKQTTIDEDGNEVSQEDSPFVWVESLLPYGKEIIIPIPLPLSTECLNPLINQLQIVMGHNLYPTLLLMGSAAMSLHYETIMSKYQNCPIPLAFGPSGTGKTTALRCALSIVGAHPNRFFSRATLEKLMDVCSKSSVPIGVDDPSFQKNIDSLCIDLFNGANSGNLSRGIHEPKTTAIITANFSTSSKEKYSSRCLMIEFSSPGLQCSVGEYTKLPDLMSSAGSSIGFCISLGKRFLEEGIDEIDKIVTPLMQSIMPGGIMPRVLPGYSTLYWFTVKILEKAGRIDVQEGLNTYFKQHIVPTIVEFQKSNLSLGSGNDTEGYVEELCIFIDHVISCLSTTKSSFCLVETTYKGKKAIGIRPESLNGINWKLYNDARDKTRHRVDIANFRQSRSFGHEKKEKCMLVALEALSKAQSSAIVKCCRENKLNPTSEISSFESDIDKDIQQWEDNLQNMSPDELVTSLLSSSFTSDSNVDKSNEVEIEHLSMPHQTVDILTQTNTISPHSLEMDTQLETLHSIDNEGYSSTVPITLEEDTIREELSAVNLEENEENEGHSSTVPVPTTLEKDRGREEQSAVNLEENEENFNIDDAGVCRNSVSMEVIDDADNFKELKENRPIRKRRLELEVMERVTRSKGLAKPFSKRMCTGENLYD